MGNPFGFMFSKPCKDTPRFFFTVMLIMFIIALVLFGLTIYNFKKAYDNMSELENKELENEKSSKETYEDYRPPDNMGGGKFFDFGMYLELPKKSKKKIKTAAYLGGTGIVAIIISAMCAFSATGSSIHCAINK
jgi:hypothetical protein